MWKYHLRKGGHFVHGGNELNDTFGIYTSIVTNLEQAIQNKKLRNFLKSNDYIWEYIRGHGQYVQCIVDMLYKLL